MKTLIIFLIIFLNSILLVAQNPYGDFTNFEQLKPIVDSIHSTFDSFNEENIYYSRSTAKGNYFKIFTKKPTAFFEFIDKKPRFSTLIEKFENLQVDRNLVIFKSKNSDYKNNPTISFSSFPFYGSADYSISLPFDSEIYFTSIQKGEYFLSHRIEKDSDLYQITGFYLTENFKTHPIPEYYAKMIDYSIAVVDVSNPLFRLNNKREKYSSIKTPIDSLIEYRNKITNNPKREEDESYEEFLKRKNIWQKSLQERTDSLWKIDDNFKSKLKRARSFAFENKKTHSDLEVMVAKYFSKKEALQLIRFDPKEGKCSYDDSPIKRQRALANMAAQIPDWHVFIRAMLNLMNDHITRRSDNSLSAAMRKTYISDIEKTGLRMTNLLLGMHFRINSRWLNRYEGNGARIGKAFAGIENHKPFLQTIEKVICDENLDLFNRLNAYFLFLNFIDNLQNEEEKALNHERLKNWIPTFPEYIQNRLVNRNLTFEELHLREKQYFQDENLVVLNPNIANVYSRFGSGYVWFADFKMKDLPSNLEFNLYMNIGETIGALSSFFEEKDRLLKTAFNNKLAQELLEDKDRLVSINFADGKSFELLKERSCEAEIPVEIVEFYSTEIENAVEFSTFKKGEGRARYIAFENGDLMLLRIPKGFSFGGINFSDLLTYEQGSFFSKSYYSYKIFDGKGNLKN